MEAATVALIEIDMAHWVFVIVSEGQSAMFLLLVKIKNSYD